MSDAFPTPTALAFGFQRDFEPFNSGERIFAQHYLLYASKGALTLRIADASWYLPPQRAAWIRAQTPLEVEAKHPITSASVLYEVAALPDFPYACRVFSMSPLAREMTLYAMRWGQDRDPNDREADQFFLSLASVCRELSETPTPFWLPRPQSDLLQNACAFTAAHMAEPLTLATVATHVHVSSRTLSRRFTEELNLSWGVYLRRVRMLRAMQLLAGGHATVTEVALQVGFNSLSAFNKAFRQFTHESPRTYQQRFRAQ